MAINRMFERGSTKEPTLKKISDVLSIPMDALLAAVGKRTQSDEFSAEAVQIARMFEGMPEEFREVASANISELFKLSKRVTMSSQPQTPHRDDQLIPAIFNFPEPGGDAYTDDEALKKHKRKKSDVA